MTNSRLPKAIIILAVWAILILGGLVSAVYLTWLAVQFLEAW